MIRAHCGETDLVELCPEMKLTHVTAAVYTYMYLVARTHDPLGPVNSLLSLLR